MPIAFYCRAKPQECEAFRIFQQARRVFLGWPLVREELAYDRRRLCACIVDPRSASDDEWEREAAGYSPAAQRQFSKNRNFVRRVEKHRQDGAIVLVPRPAEGLAYLARLTSPFEVVDAPWWGECYLRLRGICPSRFDHDDKENHHVADVTQGWRVDGGYHPVALSRIPGWIRCTLTGRATYGEFKHAHPLADGVTPYDRLAQVLDHVEPDRSPWTLDLDEIRWRLIDVMTPAAFEHLVVSLLQLEHPAEVWQHTGGPGDGGIDGFGSDVQGQTVAVMQAKYSAESPPNFSELPEKRPSIRYYAAVFLPGARWKPAKGITLLDFDWTVKGVCRHWRSLPFAMTLRVGNAPN